MYYYNAVTKNRVTHTHLNCKKLILGFKMLMFISRNI